MRRAKSAPDHPGELPLEPDRLRRRAEQVAPEECRTQSELLREALRFYVAAPGVRGAAMRDLPGPCFG